MARQATLARFEVSGEILSEDTVALLAAPDCKLAGAELDTGDFAAAWDLLSEQWQSLRQEIASLDTERLRRRWIMPLLELLGHQPQYLRSHPTYAQNRTIPLTHRSGSLPIWLLDYGASPDSKEVTGRRRISPHELFQEYLDLSDDDWGLICNGKSIRLLHDYHKTLTRNYVEADLESIFDALDVDAFRAVWRIFRASSFQPGARGVLPIEKLRDHSRQEGAEIGKELRKQVLEAIKTLGNGFLAADRSGELRQGLQENPAAANDFYQALLRIVYRLLFLLYIENKPGWTPATNPVWASSYSISRLREQAEEPGALGASTRADAEDHWEGLKIVFGMIRKGCQVFNIRPYGGELFDDERLWLIRDAALCNSDLLQAIRLLTVFERNRQVYRVNFRTLRIDALGSVYEGLLDVAPTLTPHGAFDFAEGTERKLTGSYYTPPELVAELIKSALVPVIEDRLTTAERMASGEWGMVSGPARERFERYARERLPRPGGVAAGEADRGGDLPADPGLPQRRDLRPDRADATSGNLDSSEHCGRLGETLHGGVHSVPETREREPDRAGDAPGNSSGRRVLLGGSDTADHAGAYDPGQAASRPGAESVEANGEKRVVNGERGGEASQAHETPFAIRHSPFAHEWTQTPLSIRHSLLAEHALLSIKVVDPACGSGAFLIQALDKLAERLCDIRKEGEEPSELDIREARRDVVTHCIHGVDLNPMAVELCKFTLWLHCAHPQLPLSFLDHNIRCGNSLVGGFPKAYGRADRLRDLPPDIPDEAFDPVTGDDKDAAKKIKARNRAERTGKGPSSDGGIQPHGGELHVLKPPTAKEWDAYTEGMHALTDWPESDLASVERKHQRFEALRATPAFQHRKDALDLWTAAFFWPLTDANDWNPTTQAYRTFAGHGTAPKSAIEHSRSLAQRNHFFHWGLEFPHVFAKSNGFDCVLGNPPWETFEFVEQEFFAIRCPEVAELAGQVRKDAIEGLRYSDPPLWTELTSARHQAESLKKFPGACGRFPLSAVGKLNTYALFAELFQTVLSRLGQAGLVCPTGIATDDSNKKFFQALSTRKTLALLIDFENSEGVFPDVARVQQFCLLTFTGGSPTEPEFAFSLTNISHLQEAPRRFSLTAEEIAFLNPNTRTVPVCRTQVDARLLVEQQQCVPVLIEDGGANDWNMSFRQGLFNMSTDSGLFQKNAGAGLAPLYEAKFIQQFDHRHGSYAGIPATTRYRARAGTSTPTSDQKADPSFTIEPRYWVHEADVDARLANRWRRKWLIAFRDLVRSTCDQRVAMFAVIPRVGVGHTSPILMPDPKDPRLIAVLIANLNSIPLEYLLRQKLGGNHLTYTYIKQLPVIPPIEFSSSDIEFVTSRVIELVYTSWDLQPFAEDMGFDGPPFRWNGERRAILRSELDAYFARLYGLNRKQLRYILDPQGLSHQELASITDSTEDPTCSGPDLLPSEPCSTFPGFSFGTLKDNEFEQYGVYRLRRLVLEAWTRLEAELGPAPPRARLPRAPRVARGNGGKPTSAQDAELVLVPPGSRQQSLSFGTGDSDG